MSINGIQSTVWLRIVGFTNEVISSLQSKTTFLTIRMKLKWIS